MTENLVHPGLCRRGLRRFSKAWVISVENFYYGVADFLSIFAAPWRLDYLEPQHRARFTVEERVKMDFILYRVIP